MSKYKIRARVHGQWALFSEVTGEAVIVFETFERAVDFIARLPYADRCSIDVTAVEAVQAPPHGLVGQPDSIFAIPAPDGRPITCPQCGAQYTAVPHASGHRHSTRRADEDAAS